MDNESKRGRPFKNVLRVNVSLPVDILNEIDNFCSFYGISRSAFLSLASREKIASFSMIEQMPLLMKGVAEKSKNDEKNGEQRG